MLFLQWKEGQSVPSGIFMGYLHHNNGMYSMKVSFFLEKQQKRRKQLSILLKFPGSKDCCAPSTTILRTFCEWYPWFENTVSISATCTSVWARVALILASWHTGGQEVKTGRENGRKRAKNGVFSTVWCSSSKKGLRDIQSINNHQTFCSEENEHFFPETIKTFISSDMRFTFCEQVFLQKKH